MPDRWKVSTLKYTYAIEYAESGKEIIAFHWSREPSGPVPYPHIHCDFGGNGGMPITRKTHVPSGRVALEDVVFFAISELKVKPLSDEWERIIAKNRQAFIAYKTAE